MESEYTVKESISCTGCANQHHVATTGPGVGSCHGFDEARQAEGLPSCVGGFIFVKKAPEHLNRIQKSVSDAVGYTDNPNDYSALTVEIDKIKLKFENAVLNGNIVEGLKMARELRIMRNKMAILLVEKLK
jgi:hypothetical protein